MDQVKQTRIGAWQGLSVIGGLILLGLCAYGAWDAITCYRLGWYQVQAARNVMIAEARGVLRNSEDELIAEAEMPRAQVKKVK